MERIILGVALILSILLNSALLVGNIVAKNWPMVIGNVLIDGMFVYVLYIGYKSTTKGRNK